MRYTRLVASSSYACSQTAGTEFEVVCHTPQLGCELVDNIREGGSKFSLYFPASGHEGIPG